MAQEIEETTRPWPTKTTVAKKKTSAYKNGFAWLSVCHETTIFIGPYVVIATQNCLFLVREQDKDERNHCATRCSHRLEVRRQNDNDICCLLNPQLGANINRNVFFAIRNDQRTNHPHEGFIHV